MEPAAGRFSTAAMAAMRAAIRDAAGNEVFALGTVEAGAVDEVRVLARGHRTAVPALLRIPRPGEVVIHNHPSGNLQPSEADLQIAAALGDQGVGFYIVDNSVDRAYAVVEPLRGAAEVMIDVEAGRAILGAGGVLAAALPGYEHRPQQLAMMEAVVDAYNDKEVLVVEAGTGTGKSLAYLIPSILWAKANRGRVVVSTHTINLQEQLIAKDLPELAGRADLEFSSVLVKGRGNYLCQRKAAQVEQQPALLLEDELSRELADVLAWAKKTSDGSLADLPVRPHHHVWEQVMSESDNCLRARCPFYSKCFFYTARRQAAAADVLVVNHHLLLADLALRDETDNRTQNAVLPPATRVVIDEAHHLEDVATAHFGFRLSLTALERVLSRLQSRRDLGRGLLPGLAMALDNVTTHDGAATRWIEERLAPRRQSVQVDAEQCFAEMTESYLEALAGNEQHAPLKLRLTEVVEDSPLWRNYRDRLLRLSAAVDVLARECATLLELLEAAFAEKVPQQIEFLATDLNAQRARLLTFAAGLEAFAGDPDGTCRWFELRRRVNRPPALELHAAPIDVAPQLKTSLLDPFDTVVLTSATLAVDRRFDHLRSRLGIDRVDPPERVRELLIDSPFDYENQAALLCPADLPPPGTAGYEAASHEAMQLGLRLAGGGTFVLLTSYSALQRAYDALQPTLTHDGWTVLRQGGHGEMTRAALLERFRAAPKAVLFATDSFWEGVDVRGDSLRCVIIARLPFRVPTEPIEQARVEAIEQRGGNAFQQHSIPQAVIKLKQGFGRLIRTRGDRGCVLLLDSRLATRPYGATFLHSLPPARRHIGKTHVVFARMREFFQATRGDAGVGSQGPELVDG
jgi:ATP-dependent DNA helicase DinG